MAVAGKITIKISDMEKFRLLLVELTELEKDLAYKGLEEEARKLARAMHRFSVDVTDDAAADT